MYPIISKDFIREIQNKLGAHIKIPNINKMFYKSQFKYQVDWCTTLEEKKYYMSLYKRI